MDFKLDGYCGLYCGACTMVLDTKAGKTEKPCYGCKSEEPAGHCATCVIKTCAQGKGFAFCIECAELPTCEKMQHFINDPEYPNGLAVMNNMKRIQVVGVENWLVEQDLRWRCSNCNTPHSWWDETCPQCGQAVASYKADL